MIIKFPKRRDPVHDIIRHYQEERMAEDLMIMRVDRAACILRITAAVISVGYISFLLYIKN